MRTTVLAAFLSSSFASAQTLPAFLDAAAARNIDARIAAEATTKASIDVSESWSQLLPSAALTAGYTYNQYKAEVQIPSAPSEAPKTVVIVPQNQLEGSLRLELPLVDPAKWAQISANQHSLQLSQARQQTSREQVARQVILAYFVVASAGYLTEVAERSLMVAQAQLELISARKSAGVATELEVVRSEAEVQRNRQLVADAKGSLSNATQLLSSLTGLAVEHIPRIADDDLQPEPPLEALWTRIDAAPAVQQAEADRLRAGSVTRVAWAQAAPTVAAQFTQRLTNATGFQATSALYNAGLTLQWRLDVATFQRIRANGSIESSAGLQAEKARIDLKNTIQQDWQRVAVSIEKVKASLAQKAASERAAALAKERYAAGVAGQVDVIQAERDLFSSSASHIQSRFELASARAILHLELGLSEAGLK
jgi:outer membrane protein TolC